MKKMMLLGLIVVSSACANAQRTDKSYTRALDLGKTTGKVLVVSDPVAKVTCWSIWGGLSCLRDEK